MAWPPPYMFTQYPTTPGDYQTNAGLQYGQLKEQRRAAMEREQFAKAREAARQAELQDSLRHQAMLKVYESWEKDDAVMLDFWAKEANKYGAGLQPMDQQTGGVPTAPADIAAGGAPRQKPGLPMSPGAIQAPEPGGIDAIAKAEAAPGPQRDYYAEDTQEAARAALKARAQKPAGLGAMNEATTTDRVEKAMAAGDEKALAEEFGRESGEKVQSVAEGVTLDEPALSDDPDKAMAEMRAAQERGLSAQKAKGELDAEFSKQAGTLEKRAEAVAAKNPEEAAKLLKKAEGIRPSPSTALRRGEYLEQAGDIDGARRAYATAAGMDRMDVKDQMGLVWNSDIDAAGKKLQQLDQKAAMMPSPGAIQEPLGQQLLRKGWTYQGMAFTPQGARESRKMKFDQMWAPIEQSAFHPVEKQMAHAARQQGLSLIESGLSVPEAMAVANKQFNERQRVWASIESQKQAAMKASVRRGDDMSDLRWKRSDKYVNDFKLRTKSEEVISKVARMQSLIDAIGKKNSPKERAVAWGMIIKEIENGRSTDADVNRVVGAGGLYDKATEWVAGLQGEATADMVRQGINILNQIVSTSKNYLINAAEGEIKRFVGHPGNKQLYGETLPGEASRMAYAMTGGIVSLDVPDEGKLPPPPKQGFEIEITEESSSSGPLSPDDELDAVGAR